MTKPVVLILGATGLFGGLLAQRLIAEGRFVFDVLLKFRFGGRIAHYRGCLIKRD